MTTTRPQPKRTRGSYGSPSAADRRFAGLTEGFVPGRNVDRPKTERGPGPFGWRARIAPWVGVRSGMPGSGRTACYCLRYDDGSLWIRKSKWSPLNEAEFRRLSTDPQAAFIEVTGWTDHTTGTTHRKLRRRFVFEEHVDGQWRPCALDEYQDVAADLDEEAA